MRYMHLSSAAPEGAIAVLNRRGHGTLVARMRFAASRERERVSRIARGSSPHRHSRQAPLKFTEKSLGFRLRPPGANGGESLPIGALSCSLAHTTSAGELRAAIAVVTGALAVAREHQHALELVRERAELRRELEVLVEARLISHKSASPS